MNGFIVSREYFTKDIASEDTSNYKVIKRNYFAYNPSRINVGSLALNESNEDGIVSPMYEVFHTDKDKLLSEYLYYLMKSEEFNLFVKLKAQGGVRQQLKYADLEELAIPLPDIEQQQFIIDELRNMKFMAKAAYSLIHNWKPVLPTSTSANSYMLGDICKFEGGTQPPKSTFLYEPKEGYIRLLQTRDFRNDNNVVYIPKSERHKECNATDVMIGRYGPPVFQILRGKSGAYNVALIKTIPDESVLTKDWLYYFLRSEPIQSHIIKLSTRARQAGVRPEDLAKLEISLPTIEEQNKFIESINHEMELIKTNLKIADVFNKKYNDKLTEIWGQNQELV